MNMDYRAWFAVIDPTNHKENEPISIYDHLIRQPWFLRIKSVTRTKCFIVTNKSNLLVTRTWIDKHLEQKVRKSILPGIDPPSSGLPCRLDKPIYTKTSQSYAAILKQQFSLAPNATTAMLATPQPPRKRQATIFDYNSNQSMEYPPLTTTTATKSTNNTNVEKSTMAQPVTVTPDCATMLLDLKNEINQLKTTMQPPSTTITTTVDYATELESLKCDLQSLRTFITTAVEQLKTEIVSIHAIPASNKMETNNEHTMDHTPNILQLIAELKQDIAAIAHKTRTLFQNEKRTFIPFQLTPMPT